MKELMALLGFGTGMIAGVMLYKYSQEFKKNVDMGEKKVMQSAKKLEEKAEDKLDEAEEKIKQGMDKTGKKIKQSMDKTGRKIKAGMKKAEKKVNEIKKEI